MKKIVSLTVTLLAGSVLASSPIHAAAKQEISVSQQIKDVLSLPFATGLTGAENGTRFAWVEKRNGVRNILVSDAGKAPTAVTQATQDDGTDLWGLTLSANGTALAYVEGGDPEYPDDPSPNPNLPAVPTRQTVHVVLPDGKSVNMGEGWNPAFSPDGHMLAFSQKGSLLLAPLGGIAKTVFALKGNVTSLQWSPDGTFVLFTLDRGSHALIGLWHVQQAKLEFIDPALGQDSLPTFSPDGHFVAFVREHPPVEGASTPQASFWALHVFDMRTKETQMVWTAPAGQGGRFFAPEGSGLLWSDASHVLFPWEGSGWMRLCQMDVLKTGNPACLTPDKAEISSYRLSQDKKTLFYTSNVGNPDVWHAWRQALDGSEPARLTQSVSMETDIAVAGKNIGIMTASAEETAHPVILDASQVFHVPVAPVLPQSIHFTTPQTVVVRSDDGTQVHGQLFSPPATQGSTPHPALVFVHGGPHRQMLPAFNSMGYYSNAYGMNQILAAQGYVVFAVNYRSGTGYGESFRNAAGIGRQGGSEDKDVMAAARYLKTRPDVDPAKIGIWGGSWGGYLTALALARHSALFAAGVDFHGVHDLTEPDKAGLSPAQNHAAHELEWQSSPAAYMAQWHSPILLIHGDDDYNVEFEQSTLLAKLLSAQNIPYEEHTLPNERHAFLRMQDWLSAYLWMDTFFAQKLGAKTLK